MIPVGPFQLMAPIGRGGMGEVWAATHLEHKLTVAVKVMTARRLAQPRFRKAFFREARAMAGLNHPNVVTIFDYGEIGAAAQQASSRRLRQGTPYLAMELANQGTLGSLRGQMAWPDLKRALLSLLDALAHAHARGVIHKDLKPGNILIGGDRSRTVKLTDFGIAHAVDSEELSADTPMSALGGTPAYMAPEQFDGDNRDVGPATDLYAFGCLAYAMVAGTPPFGRRNWIEVANGHLYRPVPELDLQLAVPDGFEAWLRRLLQKRPDARYSCAADAAWGLLQLTDPTQQPVGSAPVPPTTTLLSDVSERTTLVWGEVDEVAFSRPDTGPAGPRETGEKAALMVPPLPIDWRHPQPPEPTPQLLGTGLTLYPVREHPLVDRDAERDRLWDALRTVRRTGAPRAVVLEGPAGCGKTRLMRWLGRRAQEVGGATVLTATHSPISSRRDGLRAMVARHLRCFQGPRSDVAARIERLLRAEGVDDTYAWEALTEFVFPSGSERGGEAQRSVQFSSATERQALVEGVLERACGTRPVVVLLDDVHWGLDALDFVLGLFGKEVRLPALFVLTVRDSALVSPSLEASVLRELLTLEACEAVQVGHLSEEDAAELVHRLLPLEPQLADRVEKRAGGNPMFAVRLVGHWVGNDLLELSGAGFRLKKGADSSLPADLQAAWGDAVERMLRTRSEDDGLALELAAVLGHEVDAQEWAGVCRLSGVEPASDLVERLFVERMASSPAGPEVAWRFVTGMFREALEERARLAGRLELHHQRCSEILETYDDEDSLERRARHLLQAGQPARALSPLLTCAEAYLRIGDFRSALALQQMREEALVGLEASAEDPRWGRGWVVRAHIERMRREFSEAERWATRAQDQARVNGDRETLYRACREHGLLHNVRGEAEKAWTWFSEAEAIVRELGDKRALAHLVTDKGWALLHKGDAREARELFLRATVFFREAGADHEAASCWMGLCEAARKEGNFEVAQTWLERARETWEAQGSHWGVATAVNNQADLYRLMGDLSAAEAGFREALQLFGQLRLAESSIAHLNLALVLIAQDSYREARPILDAFLERLSPHRHSVRALVHCALAACCAAERDWLLFDGHAERALSLLRDTGYVDPDVADCLERAAGLALAKGQDERALGLLVLCAAQWEALDQPRRAQRLLRLIP